MFPYGDLPGPVAKGKGRQCVMVKLETTSLWKTGNQTSRFGPESRRRKEELDDIVTKLLDLTPAGAQIWMQNGRSLTRTTIMAANDFCIVKLDDVAIPELVLGSSVEEGGF